MKTETITKNVARQYHHAVADLCSLRQFVAFCERHAKDNYRPLPWYDRLDIEDMTRVCTLADVVEYEIYGEAK